ncbi:MAG: HEAT repeat domain-containing protein [Bdellovibrionales bacterium]
MKKFILIFALIITSDYSIAAIQKSVNRSQAQKVAFDTKNSMQLRWRTVTAYGKNYPNEAKPFLEKALKSPEWFMRNAAVLVLPYAERSWAISWLEKMMSDPALVVRTAAVQATEQMGGIELQSLLWTKLYSRENYHRSSSLWIRKHILETLSAFATTNDVDKFIQVLKDDDQNLHSVSLATLKKLTRQDYRNYADWKVWKNKNSIIR